MKHFSEHVSADKLPIILVLKSFDQNTNGTLDTVEIAKYDKKDYKINELADFLDPFSRTHKKEAVQTTSSDKTTE